MNAPYARLAKRLWREMNEHRIGDGAATLAFYMVLSIFPAAIFGLSLLPFLPIPHLSQAIMDLVRQALPGPAATMFTSTVDAIVSNRSGGLVSFGFLFAVWSASNGLHAVMQQLNVVYDVKEERSFVRAHLVALGLTVVFFLVVVGALGLVVFGGMLQDWVGDHFGWSGALRVVFAALRWVIIVLALHFAFAVVYAYAPNTRHAFELVTPGSLAATLGIILASVGFKIYVSHFANYDAVYGSLGAVIVLLMWLFVTGFVLLFGGELNVVLARTRGDAPVRHGVADVASGAHLAARKGALREAMAHRHGSD